MKYMWPFELVLVLYVLKIVTYFAFFASHNAKEKDRKKPSGKRYRPSVDIILPMYNEEKVVIDTIRNLLEIRYDNFAIIVVDDGSTDKGFDMVKNHFGGHPLVQLVHQSNKGKSAALNRGMSISKSEIIVTIDADTFVRSDAIENIITYFHDDRVAAVAGHIKVGNRVNLLTDMQYFEYVAIWDNDRAFSDKINGILIVPGALAAYRRSAVNAVGGFKSEVIAEDTELTLRLLYNNYVLRNAREAVAYTEAPDNLKMFFRQRVRWTTGLTQGLVKHNKKLFTHSNKWLAGLILPYTWLFRVIFPFLLPLVDYYFIYCCFFLKEYAALIWWPLIILMEAFANTYLLNRYGERVVFFKTVVLQRLYRHLLFCNYWIIFAKGLNGTLFRWRKITRKGNVRIEDQTPEIPEPPKSNQQTKIMHSQSSLVSCVCVTRNRPDLLKRSIECFLAQTYANRELIVLYEDDDTATEEFVGNGFSPDSGVRLIRVPAYPKMTLGELRNVAIKIARGEFVCQWDGDDWYHMNRIELQYRKLFTEGRHGSILTQWLVYDGVTETAYISNERLWEGSILCRTRVLQEKAYEDKPLGEDTATIEYLASRGSLCLLNEMPGLYIYVYHGNNSWDYEHWSAIFEASTALSATDSGIIADILNGRYSVSEGSVLLDGILYHLRLQSYKTPSVPA
jgi:cellulose synthase/poly-beta-1,6-N-acetylglucosamine synthase-like glycosyltransferase